MKTFAIARVSTEEQKDANNSLPAQVARVERYCAQKGLPIPKMFEFDESAYSGKRKVFAEIVELIVAEKDTVALCLDKIDRLTRDVFDPNVRRLDELRKEGKLELHFISDNVVLHKDSPATDQFRFTMGTSLAKYFSDSISDNTKRGMEGKLMRGEIPGKAPVGYKNITHEDGTVGVEAEPYWSKIVQQMYSWYGSGAYSMEQVRSRLKKDYNIKWSKGSVDAILANEFYVGIMLRKGKRYNHIYKWILNRDEWDKVQSIKAGRNKQHFKYKGLSEHQYRGLIRCADCGMAITNEKHKGHIYYHCTQYNGKHGAEWLREEDITAQLSELMAKFEVPEDTLQEILMSLKATQAGKVEFFNGQHAHLTVEYDKQQARIDALYLDKLDGRITETKYNELYTKFRTEQKIIENKLGQLTQADDSYYMTVGYLGDLSKRARELFESSRADEKRRLLTFVLSNLKLKGKEVLYEAKKPFDMFLLANDRLSWGGRADSNRRHPPSQGGTLTN